MPKAIAGNVFMGAFSYGIRQAGFDVPIHLEHNDYGVASAKMNFPNVEVRVGVENWHPETIKRVDLMFTNPPCAPWSAASHGRPCHWSEDPRLQLVTDLVDAGITMQPRAWMWESVCACWSKGHDFVTAQAQRWLDEGYHVTLVRINAMYCGSPQSRRRQFLVAHLHPLLIPAFTAPPPTIGQILKKVKLKKSEIPLLKETSCWEKLLYDRSFEYGGNYCAAYQNMTPEEQATIRCKPSFLGGRLNGERICGVLFPGGVWHPYEHRRLAYREILALQGLPDWWKVETDNFGDVGGLMQRGVLPGAGKWLGTMVLNGLQEKKIKESPRFKIWDLRKPEALTEEVVI